MWQNNHSKEIAGSFSTSDHGEEKYLVTVKGRLCTNMLVKLKRHLCHWNVSQNMDWEQEWLPLSSSITVQWNNPLGRVQERTKKT